MLFPGQMTQWIHLVTEFSFQLHQSPQKYLFPQFLRISILLYHWREANIAAKEHGSSFLLPAGMSSPPSTNTNSDGSARLLPSPPSASQGFFPTLQFNSGCICSQEFVQVVTTVHLKEKKREKMIKNYPDEAFLTLFEQYVEQYFLHT